MPDAKSVLGALSFAAQVAAIVMVTKSFAFASHFIPSESMVPTLEVGDRIAVSKWPWRYSRHSLIIDPHVSLPVDGGRLFAALPERGDVAVFTHPKTGDTMIKRVIGLPGDRIALQGGRLIINGVVVPRAAGAAYRYREHQGGVVMVRRYEETLPGGRSHPIIEQTDRGLADDMAEITIPAGHLFMMGDNRDNSLDSRFARMGVVPLENLQGRAELIGWSLHRCAAEAGLACAPRRTLSMIR